MRSKLLESVTTQFATPEQPSPFQPAKVEPLAGSAYRATAVPFGKVPRQAAVQSMPSGALATLPLPVPVVVTARVRITALNVASSSPGWSTVITHDTLNPAQTPAAEPPQPEKTELAAGSGSMNSASPVRTAIVHDGGQSTGPPSLLSTGVNFTAPEPLPSRFIESSWPRSNLATIDLAA
jgi:hypothetical protein